MLVVLTAFLTFMLTVIGFYRYGIRPDKSSGNLNHNNSDLSDVAAKIDAKLNVVKSYLNQYYLGEIEEDKLIDAAVKGYVDGLGDIYTKYLTEEEYKDLMIDVNGD